MDADAELTMIAKIALDSISEQTDDYRAMVDQDAAKLRDDLTARDLPITEPTLHAYLLGLLAARRARGPSIVAVNAASMRADMVIGRQIAAVATLLQEVRR